MEVTIGGDRIGSGKKQKQELHNYNRATFNQEQDWKSSMAPGVLYPFLCIPMTNGDSMDIDLDSFVRTLPTKGPLFGSYKLQADIFSIPMRLYNGLLHNNPTEIGLKMNQVYFPKLKIKADNRACNAIQGVDKKDYQIANNALLKYLGLSGIGLRQRRGSSTDPDTYQIVRKINAVPVLAYYDIFKNYYANKQEEYAYIIRPKNIVGNAEITKITNNYSGSEWEHDEWIPIGSYSAERLVYSIYGNGLSADYDNETTTISVTLKDTDDQEFTTYLGNPEYFTLLKVTPTLIKFNYNEATAQSWVAMKITTNNNKNTYRSNIGLSQFSLRNIDIMREQILQKNALGEEFVIAQDGDWTDESGIEDDGLPYSALFKGLVVNTTEYNNIFIGWNSFAMNGLVLKTYQSDIFNNWINTEWIEGENGINAITSVSVNEGSFEIDALNLAQKVYEYLNRIAIAGGTYEDWQEATYTSEVIRKAETPIYEGGMSAEIMFEEVIQTAETNVENDFQALGALGGKGMQVGQKGGHDIHIKAKEPVFVMGIISITPRICYTQGNEWYLTELNSYDDLHKPALDGIGFQDVILEQMAWWDTHMYVEGSTISWNRRSAGKTVAWQNYMTAVDKAFGDFAENGGKNFMVLSRNYESAGNFISGSTTINDLTTYIDPAKFNYAFAYTDLAAQNFWVQIHSKVITRRVMSAHQIPNL